MFPLGILKGDAWYLKKRASSIPFSVKNLGDICAICVSYNLLRIYSAFLEVSSEQARVLSLSKISLLDFVLDLLDFSPQANLIFISQITLIIYLYLNLISFYPFFIEEEVP